MLSESKYYNFMRFSIVFAMLLAASLTAQAKTVLISTPQGDIEVELLENDAPKTVTNFLNYIEDNRYENAFIHRNVDDFIIQGGGLLLRMK